MKWKKIVVHHSASPVKGSDGKLIGVKTIRNWHLDRGFRDIGYHFVVLADGKVEVGRAITEQGAHCLAGLRNTIAIGVCLVGDFTKHEVPEKQLISAVNLAQRLRKEFKINIGDIELHSEVKGAHTLCPGKLFPKEKFHKLLLGG